MVNVSYTDDEYAGTMIDLPFPNDTNSSIRDLDPLI